MPFTDRSIFALGLSTFIMCSASISSAEEKIPTKNSKIDTKLGARIHTLVHTSDDELVSDRDTLDFQVKRARLRFSGTIDEWITLGIQTEYSEEPNKGAADVRIIDAYVQIKQSDSLHYVFGQHMSPALRQNVTSSGTLLSIDRPALSFKSLSWGTRAKSGFTNNNVNEADSGIRGNADVRDIGATVFGTNSVNNNFHYSYYAGIYEGAQSALANRYTGRLQINFGDAEATYYNAASYFGNKSTLALGVSVDNQNSVATDQITSESVDYNLATLDIFWEKPLGNKSLTFETAYIHLDLDNANHLTNNALDLLGENKATGSESEGEGYYVQTALLLGKKWQPWVGFEQWNSNGDENKGSFQSYRVGMTYLIRPKNANIKVGIENWDNTADSGITPDSVNTLTAGFFLTF